MPAFTAITAPSGKAYSISARNSKVVFYNRSHKRLSAEALLSAMRAGYILSFSMLLMFEITSIVTLLYGKVKKMPAKINEPA
jgi:hypothetical protein